VLVLAKHTDLPAADWLSDQQRLLVHGLFQPSSEFDELVRAD